jgi:hypothetical protein
MQFQISNCGIAKFAFPAYLRLLVVVVLTSLVACSQQIDSGKHRRPKPKRVLSKNYVIGERQTAHLGDPIVKVKDYFIHRSQPFMRATDDFVLKGEGLVVEGYRDEDYTIRGETTVDGRRFTVVSLPPFKRWPYLFKSDGPAALVDKDGTIYNRVMDGNNVLASIFKLQPPGVRLLPTQQGKILAESVYANYELVYGGTDGHSINVTFREYRRNKPDEVAHFQNLVIPVDSPAMRFKDTVIQIHSADNQEFVYTVVSDASTKKPGNGGTKSSPPQRR